MAADWRNHFHKDVVVDLVGYRRRASRRVTLGVGLAVCAHCGQVLCTCMPLQCLS